MYCLRCGKQLPEGAVYCGYCGLELGHSVSGEHSTGFSSQSSQQETSPKRIRPENQQSPQGFQPGYQNPSQGFQPGHQNSQQGFQPGYQNPQQGFQPGHQNLPQGFQPGHQNPQQVVQPGHQNPPKKLKKKEKPAKKGKKTGSAARLPLPLAAVLVLLAAASLAFVFVFYVFHLKPGKDLDALATRWKKGEIGTVVGIPDENPEEDTDHFQSKEDEEFYNKLIAEYGDMLFPENPEDGISEDSDTNEDSGSDSESRAQTAGKEDNPFLKYVLEHTKISLQKPFFIKYPCDVVVTVDGPDMVKLLEDLDYRSYEDSEKLLDHVIAELDKESFETRKAEVPVQIAKEADGSLCLASASPELADALYGGVLSLYAQEEIAFYEFLSE